jgi:hypothetical protein
MNSDSIDDEWRNYVSSVIYSEKLNESGNSKLTISTNGYKKNISEKKEVIDTVFDEITENDKQLSDMVRPVCDDLYISTTTKVLFLTEPINIQRIFWKIPIVEYWRPETGVVKKQMKIVNKTREEYEEYSSKLKDIPYYTENVIKHIDNPTARRIVFKDERKITIGISKKDIMNCRGKIKNAFYNCFAVVFRFKYEGVFREIHVKIFNTGKLEIPGILNENLLNITKDLILSLIKLDVDGPVSFINNDENNNVLINSNFNCGFYIHRERLYSILRSKKYGIETSFDPCSYPGVKCKFYFNNEIGFSDTSIQNGQILMEDRHMKMSELIDNNKYTMVSFMIFRTGSCLIVGNCSEKILKFIFEFIKNILLVEYPNIHVENTDPISKTKKTKIRKKNIMITGEYYNEITRK